MQLLLTEKVTFGSPVVVSVDGHSDGAHIVQNITVPSLEEGEVKCCNVSKDMLNYWLQISLNNRLSFYSLLHEPRGDCERMWWYVMDERQLCSTFSCLSSWACILYLLRLMNKAVPVNTVVEWQSSARRFGLLMIDAPLSQPRDSKLSLIIRETSSSSGWKTLMPDKMKSCARCFGMKCLESFLRGSVNI